MAVFGVVSQSGVRTDRFNKMRGYHAVTSTRRYVLVEQTMPVMPEIGITVTVAGILDGVESGGAGGAASPG